LLFFRCRVLGIINRYGPSKEVLLWLAVPHWPPTDGVRPDGTNPRPASSFCVQVRAIIKAHRQNREAHRQREEIRSCVILPLRLPPLL
jgi:hypothetical protein